MNPWPAVHSPTTEAYGSRMATSARPDRGGCILGAAAAVLALALTLAACGGGDGGGALSDLTVTRTDVSVTATLPARSEGTEAAPATDEAPPDTTAEEPETTGPRETVTVETTAPRDTVTVETTAPRDTVTVERTAERDTVTVVETEKRPETTENAAPTTADTEPASAAAGETSSADDTPWAWIVLAAALVGIAVLGFVWWRRRRDAARTWTMRSEALARRTLASLDEVTSAGSVVTGRVEALAAEARELEARAPDAAARASVGGLRAGLDELARALEADRALRFESPPPSDEQLAYSSALIGEQVAQLRRRLLAPDPGGPPLWEPPPS